MSKSNSIVNRNNIGAERCCESRRGGKSYRKRPLGCYFLKKEIHKNRLNKSRQVDTINMLAADGYIIRYDADAEKEESEYSKTQTP